MMRGARGWRMRRKQKRVPNLAQGALPFSSEPAKEPDRKSGRSRFLDDRPEHLRVGTQRLDEYLKARGLRWVVRLRQELERVDYTALMTGYDMMGRRPYHPRTILGLIVYGMCCRQWTLRELEVLAVRDTGAWWICGGLQPDHSTIGDFFHRHREVLKQEFFVSLVRDLAERAKLPAGVVAGDGTVVEAAASHHRMLTLEAAQAAAERARVAAERAPLDEAEQKSLEGAEVVAAVAEQRSAERTAKTRSTKAPCVAPSDPEAVIQPGKRGGIHPAYKPSTLVHESGLIVAQAVDPSSETAVMNSLLAQHAEVFDGDPAKLLLDGGYNSCELLQELTERGIDTLCSAGVKDNGQRRKRGGIEVFAKSAFQYDADANVYRCPAGQVLREVRCRKDRDGRTHRQYAGAPCCSCALRMQCTTSKHGRSILRYEGEQFKEWMAEVMHHPAARKVFRRRREIAERPFAELRYRQGLTRFHRHGKSGACVEFALHCIAFNLKWAIGRDLAWTSTSVLVYVLAGTRCVAVLMIGTIRVSFSAM